MLKNNLQLCLPIYDHSLPITTFSIRIHTSWYFEVLSVEVKLKEIVRRVPIFDYYLLDHVFCTPQFKLWKLNSLHFYITSNSIGFYYLYAL